MKTRSLFALCAVVGTLVTCLTGATAAQSIQGESVASLSFDNSEVRWEPRSQGSRFILVVSAPDGKVFRKEFKAGRTPAFSLVGEDGGRLPDGYYRYELALVPTVDQDVRQALSEAREKGNSEEVMERLRKEGRIPDAPIQSGGFFIQNGSLFSGHPEDAEPGNGRVRGQSAKRPQGGITPQDIVNADDLIVQGSACVGLDCVNNESFGFDTIRLKENNTRIKFDDTSSSTGFPNNDWQLTANDSASGGANKFSIEDITGAKVPFTITAGAPTNSVFVDSTGRVGLRTSTPVLDLHATTSNTPAFRLEQNNSGGFTAQTWDIAGNEANFFVRDVTGGSRLPLRIRPGAPTSSIDVAASGNVGIGTQSPSRRLHVVGTENTNAVFEGGAGTHSLIQFRNTGADRGFFGFANLGTTGLGFFNAAGNTVNLLITDNGRIGIGVTTPGSPIQHSNGATLSAGGAWTDASSRAFKTNIHSLTARDAILALQLMNPVTFQYKADPTEKHVGFIAEDVPDLVATKDRKGLSPMDIVAVLTKVVQEQQRTIVELKEKVGRLEKRQAKAARYQRNR